MPAFFVVESFPVFVDGALGTPNESHVMFTESGTIFERLASQLSLIGADAVRFQMFSEQLD